MTGERAFDQNGKLGVRLLVTVRSGSKEQRSAFVSFCMTQGLTRRGQWSGRDTTVWEIVGSAAAVSRAKLWAVSWERPSATFVHLQGTGAGADTRAVKAKSRARAVAREQRPLRLRESFLHAVYGPRADWPILSDVPPGYLPFLLTDDDKREFFAAAHLEYVRTMLDSADDGPRRERWLRAERTVEDWQWRAEPTFSAPRERDAQRNALAEQAAAARDVENARLRAEQQRADGRKLRGWLKCRAPFNHS